MANPQQTAGEMPFLDHLEELRWRIIYSLIAIVVGVAIGLYISFVYNLIEVLQRPIIPYMNGKRLGVLHPMDGFTIRLQLAVVIGIALSLPVVAFQLWSFLAPALHKPEKRVVVPVLFAALILFVLGVALAWFFVLPLTLEWLQKMNADTFELSYVASEYFSFVTSLALAFGLAFEVPLLFVALVALGIMSASVLNKSRKLAVVAIFVVSAILSPGDAIIATLAMAAPLYLLYEISVVVAFAIERSRRRRKEREDMDLGNSSS